MDVSALKAAGEQFKEEIAMVPYIGMEQTVQHCTVVESIQNEYVLTEGLSTAELEPYKKNPTIQDPNTLTDRTLTIYKGQAVIDEEPEKLRNTYRGKQLIGLTPQDDPGMPDEFYVIAMVAMALGGKVNSQLAFKGVRNGSGTTTAALANGFDTITAADIAGNKITTGLGNLKDLAYFTQANIGDELYDAVTACPQELLQRSGILKLIMPAADRFLYNKWYKDEFGSAPYNDAFGRTWLHGFEEKVQIVTPEGKTNSSYIHLTTQDNLYIGVDKINGLDLQDVFRLENRNLVRFWFNFSIGFQFESVRKERMVVFRKDLTS